MHYPSDSSHWKDIFLDRDGVINENRDDHVKSWQEFRFLPGALEALRILTERRYRVFIVTNQAAVNRGLLSPAALEEIHLRMVATIEAHNAHVAGIRFCPHREDEACECRKPRPGMLLSLAAERQIDLAQAHFVGDALTDMAAGHAAGCRPVLVLTGRGREQVGRPDFLLHRPRHVAQSLLDAVHWLIDQPHPGTTPGFAWARRTTTPGAAHTVDTTGAISC